MEDFNNTSHSNKDKLPPRSVYHAQNKGNEKNNYRIKLPFIRLISLVIIILIISLVSIKLFSDDSQPAATEPEVDKNPPISNIGKADDEEEEDEEEAVTPPIENATVVKPIVTEKPVTPTDQPDNTTDEPIDTTEEPLVTTPQTSEKPDIEYIEHVVGQEENLFRIAMKYFNSSSGVEIIKKHNGLTDNNIKVGQVLKIPKQ